MRPDGCGGLQLRIASAHPLRDNLVRRLGCVVNTVLVIAAMWLVLVIGDSPELEYFERAWAMVSYASRVVLSSIWHVLGG